MPTTVTTDVARNRVKIALYDLYLKHKASLAKVRVQEKPTKLVLCKNTVKEGEIKLVAMATTITTVKQGSRVNQNDVHLGVLYEDPKEGPMVGYLSPSKTIWPSDLRETMVVPYWLVRTTPNEDEANMEHCSISVGSKESPFDLPMLQNTKAITADEELLVFKRVQVAKRDEEGKGKKGDGKGKGKGKKGTGHPHTSDLRVKLGR